MALLHRGEILRMPNRIAGFDGLRALAIILVFFQHKMPRFTGDLGLYGVQLFFAISGFLIIGILYSARERIELGVTTFKTELSSFLKRRTLRIFPIYYLTLFVAAILSLNGLNADDWNPLGHIFYIFYLANVWIGAILQKWPGEYSHLWSLSVEEQFYLISAPIFLFISARRHLTVCVLFVFVGFVMLFVDSVLNFGEIYTFNDSFINFASIAIGGYVGLLYKQRRALISGDRLIALAFFVFFLLFVIQMNIPHPYAPYVTNITPFVAGIIVLLVCATQKGVVVTILENKLIAHLGQISYGFYLYHNFIYFNPIINKFPYSLINHFLEFCITVAVAEISWRVIEQPLIALGKNMKPRKLGYDNPSLEGALPKPPTQS
jgi:peptidoglycan/LPS O-acetylase OafA/YrhL